LYSLLSRCIHTIMFQQVSVMQDNNYFYLYFFLLKCDIRCSHLVARCRRVTSCLCFFVSGLSKTRSSSRDPHPLHTLTHGSTRRSGITLDLTNDALIRLCEVRRPLPATAIARYCATMRTLEVMSMLFTSGDSASLTEISQ